jgi:aspartate aminotransferase-like enzyme
MATFDPRVLLDPPPFPDDGYARLADRLAAILRTRQDVLLVQGEAIVALEAAATSLASPALHALNIVTSPYGRMFGHWLRRGGATVRDLVAEAGMPVEEDAVGAALAAYPEARLVSLVHAESATGILNPLPAISRLAKARGALLVVDAVASLGGHPVDVDAFEIDVCAMGPQKSLGGPAGISALSVSPAAWRAIERPGAPAVSILSLADHKAWLDSGRGALPGMPAHLEWHALSAALDRFEAEGVDAAVARHAKAAAAARAGLRALGAELWIDDPERASNLVTAARLPAGFDQGAFLRSAGGAAAGIEAAVGVAGLVRLNHTGQRAALEPVLASLAAFAAALERAGRNANLPAAERAATEASHAR